MVGRHYSFLTWILCYDISGETQLHVACMKNNVLKLNELLMVPGRLQVVLLSLNLINDWELHQIFVLTRYNLFLDSVFKAYLVEF